ncbi:hypothetical protein BCY88_24330 [Paraburkholderia fungorum]|uniref:Uncharacterized protein n=1 Tax=Paraburkholderia fungorum TaxID=134537 RepID=A0A3R7IAM6_9BURK|nr:hypothetical protein BCY88_24330 [Paraburkholderia fungorum]
MVGCDLAAEVIRFDPAAAGHALSETGRALGVAVSHEHTVQISVNNVDRKTNSVQQRTPQ